MPYCQTSLQIKKPDEVENVLTNFTKENFVDGHAVHKLCDGGCDIDAGKNDTRAYHDKGEETRNLFAAMSEMSDFSTENYSPLLPNMAST